MVCQLIFPHLGVTCTCGVPIADYKLINYEMKWALGFLRKTKPKRKQSVIMMVEIKLYEKALTLLLSFVSSSRFYMVEFILIENDCEI